MPPLQPLATTAQKAAETATAVRTQRDGRPLSLHPAKEACRMSTGHTRSTSGRLMAPVEELLPRQGARRQRPRTVPTSNANTEISRKCRAYVGSLATSAPGGSQRLCGLQAFAATPAASCTSTSWSSASGSGQPVRVASIRSRSSSRAQSAPSTAPGRRELVSDRFGPTQAASPRSQIEVRAPVKGPDLRSD